MLKSVFIFYLLLLTLKIDARLHRTTPAPDSDYYDYSKVDVEAWTGKWFPFDPNEKPTAKPQKQISPTSLCDDGKHSIGIDFDPFNKQHSYNYLCLGNRTTYKPNLNYEAILTEYFIPPAYLPPIKCLNESISYDETLPTYGAFRPLPPKYGSYQYLPPQRWLHSLAEGAIVMLYHPCAFSGQVKILQNTLQGCLYHHVITPSQSLTPERPLALLAWGKMLQISVVDERIVVDFIKKNFNNGILIKNSQLYVAGLISEAHLVTDENDTEICGYKQM